MDDDDDDNDDVQDDLRRIAGADEAEQPFTQDENARPHSEERNDQELHDRQREDINRGLSQPIPKRRRRAILARLETLEMKFLREEVSEALQR